MKPCVIVAAMLMTLMVSQQVEKAEAAFPVSLSTSDLITGLAKKIVSLFGGGSVNFLGFHCTYRQFPQIRRLQLYYKVKMTCPAFPGLEGEAHTRNSRHALGRAVEDFLRKALENGYITKQEAAEWLAKE